MQNFDNSSKPLVSIGVPVFNGEIGLANTLESLINQDYLNLEIIVSDNASTDATASICEEFARRDSRVKYYISETNRGAIWNFNRVSEIATGKYFMWAAHDDRRELSFVSACVAKLESCPDAVLCQAKTALFIEGKNELMCVNDLNSFDSVNGLVERYKETLYRFPMTAIYGLYRLSAIHKTHGFTKSIATDVAFIQEISIFGNFVQVPGILFSYMGREKWNTINQDYQIFFGKKEKPWWYLPFAALFRNHWNRVNKSPISLIMKIRLWTLLIKYQSEQIAIKILIKLVFLFCPDKWKEFIGVKMYWNWMHSVNVKVNCHSLFLSRVIKPRLGLS